MPIDPIVLIGAGGHAKVVADALLKSGRQRAEIILLDQAEARVGTTILGIAVERYAPELVSRRSFHVCIGNNDVRRRFFDELSEGLPLTVIHPNAILAEQSRIEAGSFVAAQAVVGPDAIIGRGCIVNHGAVIDHEVTIDGFCHVAPGATLGGTVRLGAAVLVGAGANVLPGITIGANTIVGAGSVVVNNLLPNVTYAGVPARRLR